MIVENSSKTEDKIMKLEKNFETQVNKFITDQVKSFDQIKKLIQSLPKPEVKIVEVEKKEPAAHLGPRKKIHKGHKSSSESSSKKSHSAPESNESVDSVSLSKSSKGKKSKGKKYAKKPSPKKPSPRSPLPRKPLAEDIRRKSRSPLRNRLPSQCLRRSLLRQ